MSCWPDPTDKRAWSIHRNRPCVRTVIKDNAARNLESKTGSTTWVVYRAHG